MTANGRRLSDAGIQGTSADKALKPDREKMFRIYSSAPWQKTECYVLPIKEPEIFLKLWYKYLFISKLIFKFGVQKQNNMKAIINRQQTFGTLNGVITKNSEIQTLVNQHIKKGTAKKLIDTEETLMYELGEEKPNSNMHPIFEQALKPFMP